MVCQYNEREKECAFTLDYPSNLLFLSLVIYCSLASSTRAPMISCSLSLYVDKLSLSLERDSIEQLSLARGTSHCCPRLYRLVERVVHSRHFSEIDPGDGDEALYLARLTREMSGRVSQTTNSRGDIEYGVAIIIRTVRQVTRASP
jgi:hypothetical protein